MLTASCTFRVSFKHACEPYRDAWSVPCHRPHLRSDSQIEKLEGGTTVSSVACRQTQKLQELLTPRAGIWRSQRSNASLAEATSSCSTTGLRSSVAGRGKGQQQVALLVKTQPDGSGKSQLFVDLLRSGVNGDVANPERVVLPRASDLTSKLLHRATSWRSPRWTSNTPSTRSASESRTGSLWY